jgi:hypothetical protein
LLFRYSGTAKYPCTKKSTNSSRPKDMNLRRLFSLTKNWQFLRNREQGLKVQVYDLLSRDAELINQGVHSLGGCNRGEVSCCLSSFCVSEMVISYLFLVVYLLRG